MLAAIIKNTRQIFLLSPDWHAQTVRVLICGLMISLYILVGAGIVSLSIALYHAVANGWATQAKVVITDVVIILALLELVRTFQFYLELGRVKLRFIIDAALVVLIGELIGLWYQDHPLAAFAKSMVAIIILTLLRVIAVKYSPEGMHET